LVERYAASRCPAYGPAFRDVFAPRGPGQPNRARTAAGSSAPSLLPHHLRLHPCDLPLFVPAFLGLGARRCAHHTPQMQVLGGVVAEVLVRRHEEQGLGLFEIPAAHQLLRLIEHWHRTHRSGTATAAPLRLATPRFPIPLLRYHRSCRADSRHPSRPPHIYGSSWPTRLPGNSSGVHKSRGGLPRSRQLDGMLWRGRGSTEAGPSTRVKPLRA